MNIIYMLPFLLNENGSDFICDLKMADDFFKSLEKCEYKLLLIYNQGCFSNEDLSYYLSKFNVSYKILGNGHNDGITFSRYSMINYIKENYSDIKYVAEVHVDMIFTRSWDRPLIEFLEKTNEPMVCPRIVYYEDNVYKVTGKEEAYLLPDNLDVKINFMESLSEDKIDYGFVHPVIHKFNILKKVNPYDVRFLVGKQGYEDDSILLGYNYYMGTKENWKPKMYYKSCVYHKTMGQRGKIENKNYQMLKNFEGLKIQYGAYGQKELSRIYSNNEIFRDNYEEMIIDNESSLKETKIYNQVVSTSYKSLDIYESRYILRTDDITYKSVLNIPKDWWSRFYEYAWASKFVDEEDVSLDAGCGVIHPFKYYLASKCNEVHAVDIDERIIDRDEIINQQKNYFNEKDISLSKEYLEKIILKNEDLKSLSYKDESFDKIYCISVLHCLSEEDILEVLKEFKRILKANGLLIITVDSPTITVENLINNICEVGLKLNHNLDLNKYEGAIYSNLSGGINCFRILATK